MSAGKSFRNSMYVMSCLLFQDRSTLVFDIFVIS